MWNGNLEPPLRTFVTDPEHIVRWAWRTHPEMAPRIATLRALRPELVVVRLPSRRAVDDWVAGPLAAVA